ncbi:MAG TPA: alkaline phosphatase family protein [Solirubrobacteraceae bacterium]|jgi:DNA-binding beta-propeller fold protein YncE|nr:alkaline phosphatase family protein [Solirubrobacteraceae bacterium]
MTRRLLAPLGAAALLAGAGVALAQSSGGNGRIGPDLGLINTGQALHPFGRQVGLGNFPTGGAATPDGRFYWTVSAGRGFNDIRIVSVASGQVVQVVRLAGASGGIVMDSSRPLVYVSGVVDSTDTDNKAPPGTPGTAGDTVLVFRYDASGRATFDHQIKVPPPAGSAPPQVVSGQPGLGGTSPPQNFPPSNTTPVAWPDRLAIARDGATLLVPLNLADQAAVVDVASQRVRYVKTGNYPYGAAISRDGKLGFVSNETPGTVSVIDLKNATKVKDIQVGGHLSHPEALVADPVADRVYVTVTNSDEVGVIDVARQELDRVLPVGRPEGLGTAPDALAVTPDGTQLLVAEGGANEISVFGLPAKTTGTSAADYPLIGRIPTAQYPTDVQAAVAPSCATVAASGAATRTARKRRHRHRGSRARARRRARRRRARSHGQGQGQGPGQGPQAPTVSRSCLKLLYISAKGPGTGPNPLGPQPNTPQDTDNRINETQYLPLINIGAAGIADYPTDDAIRALDATANAQLRPSNAEAAPVDTPLRPDGPIKHVFYIVRENRTYDQVLGDDPRGDGDPRLTLFGSGVTPNAHALVQRFPLIDHFYSNSEASIDGHFWTSAASVSDYVNKNWFQNYRAGPNNSHGRPYDFGVYSVTWPANGFLFDQADRQGISYFNYGEAIAGVVPLNDKDRTSAENQRVAQKYAKSDLGAGAFGLSTPAGSCFPNDASVGKDAITGQTVFDSSPPAGAPPGSESRSDCFARRFASQVAAGTVPTFNYLVLSNDHTRVLDPGAYTPTAMVADNDYGLGQIVSTITHSSIWSSSAIFVTEDDSQDGADHVDAHRTVGLVISPFAKAGAVVHTRYDMLSMIRSMELIMGMRPLYIGDQLATPMYDAFQSSPVNAAPFDAIGPKVNLLATNPAATSASAARELRFRGLDQITQEAQDRLLWRSVHGPSSPPPPPGPNAVVEQTATGPTPTAVWSPPFTRRGR